MCTVYCCHCGEARLSAGQGVGMQWVQLFAVLEAVVLSRQACRGAGAENSAAGGMQRSITAAGCRRGRVGCCICRPPSRASWRSRFRRAYLVLPAFGSCGTLVARAAVGAGAAASSKGGG